MLWKGVLVVGWWFILSVGAQQVPPQAVSYQCEEDRIKLLVNINFWGQSLLTPASLSFGNCVPTLVDLVNGLVLFDYLLLDCAAVRVVTRTEIVYSNFLTYVPSQGIAQTFALPVVCSYSKPKDWVLPIKVPATGTLTGEGRMEFSMHIMNEDFTTPSKTKFFFLGAPINIEATVKTGFHQPTWLFIEECIAASSQALEKSSINHTIITNHGCFSDGKTSDSKYLSRTINGGLRLTLQAFKFADFNTEIYIHCWLTIWDPSLPASATRKACSFNQQMERWQLLDNPSQSSLCTCCDAVCKAAGTRQKRESEGEAGLVHTVVLGPFQVQSQESRVGS
uniref:ZP domain-containing protein n=2 Tax=Latimeria chalumnae TaxID=7897 RepID=H3AH70_LATCH